MRFIWPRRMALEDRIRYLEEENEALVASAAAMRDNMQQRIYVLIDEKHRLRIERDAYQRALKLTQAERDKAIAEVKRLDGKLVQIDCENLRLNGLLSTAEERLAGYERVTS